ncbi:nonsense-mediated mRNA decay factor SMG8 isoform X2 [Danaus plexippus]|uniref:nonsense-mediated mRNA decay factor SMG8 isoform X2 n=1 Tax=Danaus plexippus TaxID=13037 RepID=UPI002AB0CA2A|nr:nonsense-mediated mRNA decay factor SMG8 isoform X2 [Danaus plexippus]
MLTEVSAQITSALHQSWAAAWQHGRLCCPRLLFHFKRAPTPLRADPAGLKRLEHAVEDQIYFILRKSRLITNVCAKSLFAIPKNEEFVYISAEEVGSARDTSSLLRGLVQMCSGSGAPTSSDRPSFRRFLQGHLNLAFGEGFDDNVGKYAMSTSYFELPSASCWRGAARVLHRQYSQQSTVLFDALATDVRFSQARCAKVLPIAQASYAEGLPPHYSSQHHAHKLVVALGVVEAMARGPLAGGARARLRAACDTIRRARELCEEPSLTHHPCIHPKHDSSKEHSSGVRYVSACNCGRTRVSREDPYCARSANYTFYTLAAEQCNCDTLQAISFPVFQPSTPTFRAASVKGATVKTQELSEVRQQLEVTEAESPQGEGSQRGSWSPPDVLSPGSARDEDEEDPEDSSDEGIEVVTVQDNGTTEKSISRQPSTTEYLPGMLHTGSPAALLPAFPSWSLVCLGASSLYSHSAGLPEHLQPGFLPHTNYLLPWDCAVRLERPERGDLGVWRGRGRGKAPSQSLTVKIFIGYEYECPRGHRFMMSSPDTVVSGGSGWSREAGEAGAGALLASSSMPVLSSCLCRAAQPAHLARLHVVTPKASIHVTLDPKVQPVPGGPVFIPQPVGSPPIKLSSSAYWVLRFPYVYAHEHGALPRARLPPAGNVLQPMFGLQE